MKGSNKWISDFNRLLTIYVSSVIYVCVLLKHCVFTVCKQSLGQGNVLTCVCHSVHKEGVGFEACNTGEGVCTLMGGWGSACRGVGQTPSCRYVGYGWQTGGTHSTGMLSCFSNLSKIKYSSSLKLRNSTKATIHYPVSVAVWGGGGGYTPCQHTPVHTRLQAVKFKWTKAELKAPGDYFS